MKILVVTTLSGTANAFLVPHVKFLVDKGHSVDLAFNINHEPAKEFIGMRCSIFKVDISRSPINIMNISAFWQLKKIINEKKYDIVHTHTPIASMIARVACIGTDVKVIYTAHGFHFFRGSSIKSWLFFFPVEWWLSKYTNTIITINMTDYSMATRFMRSKNVEYIPGIGVDLDKFRLNDTNRELERQRLGLGNNDFVILSVGELNKNKNHSTIIKSLSLLNDDTIKYLICGEGPLDKGLRALIKKHGLQDRVFLLGYVNDISRIYWLSDAFVFPSKREGLGIASIEAMAAGLPLLTSNVHGINDYSMSGVTGYKYEPTDVKGFAEGIHLLKTNKSIRLNMSQNCVFSSKRFDIKEVMEKMDKIYSKVLNGKQKS